MSLPFCCVSIAAMSSAWSAMRSPQPMRSRPRRVGESFDQGPSNAACAARTARSMSARPDSANSPHGLPVVGLVETKRRPSTGGTRSPPMWLSKRRSSGVTVSMDSPLASRLLYSHGLFKLKNGEHLFQLERTGNRLAVEADQREARDGIVHALEVARRLREDHFQRGPHLRREQVPAARGTVLAAEHDVGVHARLVALEGEVAEEREHLDLLAHLDAVVVLVLPVEIAERRLLERADGAE